MDTKDYISLKVRKTGPNTLYLMKTIKHESIFTRLKINALNELSKYKSFGLFDQDIMSFLNLSLCSFTVEKKNVVVPAVVITR